MFYRRKYYIVKDHFVETFNLHFNQTNLPNQIKNGARLIGRWMNNKGDGTHEIFASWEYDSIETYKEIETAVRSDQSHRLKIEAWYDAQGGRRKVFNDYILDVRNEELISTLEDDTFGDINKKT
ncbi:NIPSNAP family protein [Macrococcus brunensis]|uniref:NIPSNAP family protein n=1 Tax=Macrococcus brunensis TaxID=198483 RepID=UPI001EEFB75F|nr:NIPSNAP family protein [Macrococcus brunensis]ULG72312.1 NIPSNAP family protein [Macrococcus brunensis]